MAKQQTKRSRQEWEQLVEEFEATGKSLKVFSQERKLNRRTFTWWRWRLRDDGEKADPKTAKTPKAPKASALFAPVVVAAWPQPAQVAVGAVEAALPGGVRLRFEHRLDLASLRELAEAFGSGGDR
jgi:hypothetical protein